MDNPFSPPLKARRRRRPRRLTPALGRRDFETDAEHATWRRRAGYDEEDSADRVPRTKVAKSDLSADEFVRTHRAVVLANVQGVVLNVMLTISWSTIGVTADGDVEAKRKALLERLRKWLKRYEQPVAFLWVDEVGKRLGRHTHILVHIHPTLDLGFRSWLPRSLRCVTKSELAEDRTDGRGGRVTTLHIGPHGGRSTYSQWRAFRYLMKGVGAARPIPYPGSLHGKFLLREFARLRVVDQGVILGQRSGTSRAINKSGEAPARAKLGPLWYERLCPAPDPYVIGVSNTRRSKVAWFFYKDFQSQAELLRTVDTYAAGSHIPVFDFVDYRERQKRHSGEAG